MTTINVDTPDGGRAVFTPRTVDDAGNRVATDIPGTVELAGTGDGYCQVTIRTMVGTAWSESFAVRIPDTGTHALADLDRLPLGHAAAGGFALADRVVSLEDTMAGVQSDLEPITIPAEAWAPDAPGPADRVAAEWHPDHGWVTWIDLPGLSTDGFSGDLTLHHPGTETVSTSSIPARWGMRVLTEDVGGGVSSITCRLDILDENGTKANEKGAAVLDALPAWMSQVRHDVIIPANYTARPAVVLAGLGADMVGRVGLTAPWIGTAFERSE